MIILSGDGSKCEDGEGWGDGTGCSSVVHTGALVDVSSGTAQPKHRARDERHTRRRRNPNKSTENIRAGTSENETSHGSREKGEYVGGHQEDLSCDHNVT